MKTNETKNGMKGMAALTLLLALTAIGAGCGSAKEFEIQMGEDTPVESQIVPEAAPEEVAVEPSSDIADETVLSENSEAKDVADDGIAEEKHLVVNRVIGDMYLKEIQKEAKPVQYGIASSDRTNIYKIDAKKYVVARPGEETGVGQFDIKVKDNVFRTSDTLLPDTYDFTDRPVVIHHVAVNLATGFSWHGRNLDKDSIRVSCLDEFDTDRSNYFVSPRAQVDAPDGGQDGYVKITYRFSGSPKSNDEGMLACRITANDLSGGTVEDAVSWSIRWSSLFPEVALH